MNLLMNTTFVWIKRFVFDRIRSRVVVYLNCPEDNTKQESRLVDPNDNNNL